MSQIEREVEWIVRRAPSGWEKLVVSGVPRILARLMAQRGVTVDEVERFLRPKLRDLTDPFELPELEQAVERIFRAIDGGEKICIYGDYDVDGVSSTAILKLILEAYGVSPMTFIPHRSTEGYGLSEGGVERCLREAGEFQLLITVDCGTVSNRAIANLKADGIETVVVDHHEMGSEGRPDCVALVNPKATGDKRSYLCAAGVVFKLAHGLLKKRQVADFDLKQMLDLVAVATISDIVPLVEENRLLVRHGLRVLERAERPGLKALLDLTETKGPLSSADIGFRIGPRLNAAGRMDEPEQALATLLSSPGEARDWAERLERFNRNRRKLEQEIFAEAMAMLEKSEDLPVIVVGSRDWHAGVVGIVASRLMRRYHKPTFVISIDEQGIGKGSGRSVPGVSLVDAIQAGRDDLLAGGGHHMAAGLSVEEGKIARFRENFAQFVRENTRREDLMPKIEIDGVVELSELSLDFLSKYELLHPFGNSNPQPVFMAREVWLTEPPKELKNNHLRLFLRQGYYECDAMFFGGGAGELPDPPWDIAFTVDRNCFRDRVSVQISIQGVRSAAMVSDEGE